jgi:hypothetical protein
VDTNEILKKSLEHFKQQREKRIEEVASEIAALDTMIRQIQMQLGETLEDLASPLIAMQGPLGGEIKTSTGQGLAGGGTNKFRPDEFFGMKQAEAARAYLEKIGHAMSLDDIFKAITAGGCKVGGADPKRTLLVVLSQSKRDFVNTGGGNWGLRKFYPNMPKLGRPEGTIPKKAPTKRFAGRLAKRNSKTKATTKLSPAGLSAVTTEEKSPVVQ